MARGNTIIRKIIWTIIGAFLCVGALTAFAPQFACAEEAPAACSIDYIFVESPHLEPGETQRIAVGFSSAPISAPQALVVTDEEGSTYEIPVTMNVGLDYLFSTSSLPEEQYQTKGLVFESGETTSFGGDATATFGIGLYDSSSAFVASYDSDGFDTRYIDNQDSFNSVDAYSLDSSSSARSRQFVIVLDAGHGGWDSGAVGNGLQEKLLTLKIARCCKSELEQYDGVKVVMVRDSDAAMTSGESAREELQRRCALANENHADFYMSIHINSGGGAGVEVWIPNSSTWYQSFHEEGTEVGNKVLDRISALGLADRGLKDANYEVDGNRLYYPDGSNADALAVIRYCREYGIPAVLVEHGFIDNSRDAAKLSDDSFLKQLGIADAQAVVDRFGLSKVKKPEPTVTDEANRSVTLQWNEIPGATQYAIALCNSDGSFKTYTYDCTDTSYTVNGLTNGQSYTFLVQAKVDGKWTPFSERDYVECTLTPRPRASAEPAGDGEVSLTWAAVDGADAYAVAERLGDGSYRTYTYSASGTSYTVTGLQCGVEHRFLVQARVAGRWSSFGEGNLVSCVPSGPTRPSVSATASDGSVALAWAAVPGAERYAVAWRRSGDTSWRTSTYDCRGGSYTVTGLSNGTSYEFVVQARFPGRWSDFGPGDVVSATPSDPTAPRASAEPAGDGEVSLTWAAVDGADAYAVAERLGDGSYRTYTYSASGTSYTVTGLQCGVEHRFLVQARVAGRWSSFGEGNLVSCVPSGPTRPSVSATASDGSVALAWAAVPGAERYAVAWRRSGDTSWRTSTYDCRGGSYTVTGLSNGTSYEFVVQARFPGRWSDFGPGDVVSATPSDPTAPRASAEPAGDGEVSLTWAAVDGADAYAVAERLGDGSYRTYTYSASGTSYTVTGLQCGVEHRFLVQARVAGRWSSFGEGNLVSCVPSGPTRPSVSATASDGSVALAWAAVPGAERYAVAWRRSGDTSWRTSTYDCRGGSYTVTGLSNGTSYEFVVQARFPGRWSDFGPGDVVSATTKGTPIMGAARTTIDRMVSVYEGSGATYPSSVYASKGAVSIRSFCTIVYNEATAEGVRPEVLFAQAMHETGWLRFGGDVRPDQCNFGGLGAVGNGASGLTFPDVSTGLRAQVQHLKAYASTEPLRSQCVDPRFRYVVRGCAPCVEDLAGRWAADRNYAAPIVSIINRLI